MSNRRQRSFVMLAGGLLTLLGFQAAPVGAQEDDSKNPFSFSASQSVYWDDNIYRTRRDEQSDLLTTTTLGINFDKEYSRQGFHGGVSVGRTWYRSESKLNNTSPDARLRWDWRIGDRWSGVLGYSYNEAFVGFDGIYHNDQKRIMRKLGRANASADFWWHPNWAVGFGFSDVRNDYRDNARPVDEYEAQEMNLNFTYRPSTGNRLVLSLRSEEGQYQNRNKEAGSLREWEQRDVRLSGQWRLTGVTQLTGYVGYTKREYEYASNRDFSGMTGKLGFQWTPTGKAIIDVSWRREIGADMDNVSNYAVSHGWTLRPTWIVSSKVRVGASYEYLKRTYGGDPGLGSDNPPRDAHTQSYGLNVQYLPVPTASIGFGVQHAKRDAKNVNAYDYRAQSVWLSGSYSF
jgi:exopolysaccharide biosynthesis operon protein EpsL